MLDRFFATVRKFATLRKVAAPLQMRALLTVLLLMMSQVLVLTGADAQKLGVDITKASQGETILVTKVASNSQLVPPKTPTDDPANANGKTEFVTLPAVLWPVGKWPEGLVSDGKTLWIAESGDRRIAQLDMQSGKILQRVKVGRLPVDMEITPDGDVYALVYTDSVVWHQRKNKKGKRFAKLRHYPEAMEADQNTIWALVLPDGSSASAKVVRLDRGTADAIGSHILGRNASEMTLHKGVLWVVHSFGPQGGQLSKLDPRTLADQGSIAVGDAVSKIEANDYGIFAAGGVWNQSGVVVRFDPKTGQQTGRIKLPGQFIYSMAISHDYVVVAGYQGRLWIIDGADMSVRRQIDLDIGPFQPGKILIRDDKLYITSHRGQGQNGSVVVVSNWRP